MGFIFESADVSVLQTRDEVIQKAKALKALGGSECEREERERHEDHLLGVLYRQENIAFHWAVGHVTSDQSARRVNGQHSSAIFLKEDLDWTLVKFPIVIIEEHYQCDTARDRAHLFEQFDQPWSGRNREDMIGPHLAQQPDLKGLDRYAANRATQGLQWYLHKVEGATAIGTHARGQFDLLYLNSEIHAFLLFCKSLGLDKRKTAEMGSKPVIAAMFHTTRQGGQDDQEFWRRVSGGKGSIMDTTSHAYQLAEFLEKARDARADWPTPVRNKFLSKRSPNDVEVFFTCLRLFWGYKHTKPVEMVEALRGRTAQEVAKKIWPLPEIVAA